MAAQPALDGHEDGREKGLKTAVVALKGILDPRCHCGTLQNVFGAGHGYRK